MRKGILVLALAGALSLGGRSEAQPPGKRGGPGAGESLDRIIDGLKLKGEKKETLQTAATTYRENARRVTDLASASLLLKLREVVSAEEFAALRKATERSRTGPGGGTAGRGRTLGGSDMAERILSFDKNKDGKVSKDELPERLQYLMEKGDTNKDGFLDRDEIKKVAADQPREEARRGRPNPGGSLAPAAVERALNDLKLSGTKKDAALSAVKSCQEDVRKLTAMARADLLLRAGDVLGAEELKKFTEAVDRLPVGGNQRPPFRGRPDR